MAVLAALPAGCPYHQSGLPPFLKSSSLKPKVPAAGIYHTVARDENLWGIAKTYDVNLQVLAEVNNLKPPYTLRENTKLFIPGAFEARSVEIAARSAQAPTAVQEYAGTLSWPVRGLVESEYGVRDGEQHNGISIRAEEGTPIRSAADGTVGHVGDIPGFGNVVLIEHADRIVTVYAHLKDTHVKRGTEVKNGQVIGTVGSSGRVKTPSLYFEVRSKSLPRNPLFFLPREQSRAHRSEGRWEHGP